MADPTGFAISTAVSLDLGWKHSYHACCGVFQSIHTCTHTAQGVHVQMHRGTEVPAAAPLPFSGTLGLPLHLSADKG